MSNIPWRPGLGSDGSRICLTKLLHGEEDTLTDLCDVFAVSFCPIMSDNLAEVMHQWLVQRDPGSVRYYYMLGGAPFTPHNLSQCSNA